MGWERPTWFITITRISPLSSPNRRSATCSAILKLLDEPKVPNPLQPGCPPWSSDGSYSCSIYRLNRFSRSGRSRDRQIWRIPGSGDNPIWRPAEDKKILEVVRWAMGKKDSVTEGSYCSENITIVFFYQITKLRHRKTSTCMGPRTHKTQPKWSEQIKSV
jgi:hypothetical protein